MMRVTKQPDATCGMVQNEGKGGGNVDTARAFRVGEKLLLPGQRGSSPCLGKDHHLGKR